MAVRHANLYITIVTTICKLLLLLLLLLLLTLYYFSTFVNNNSSTAVEQTVTCAPITQRVRVRSPVGTSFLAEVFSGVFLTCKTNVRKLWAHICPRISFGLHNHPFIFILFEWMCEWMVYIVFHVPVVLEVALGTELIPSSGEALHVLVWSKKSACDSKLIPLHDRSWHCKARVAWVT